MAMLTFKILFLLMVLIMKNVEFVKSQVIAKGPVNTTANDGDTVQLDCDTDYLYKSSVRLYVVWFHNSSGTKISEGDAVLLSSESTKWNRYSIEDVAGPNKAYNLKITAFASEDAGFYSCVILTGENEEIASVSAVLSIAPPGTMTPPTTSVNCSTSNRDAEIGDNVTVTCQCEGGNPTPVLSLIPVVDNQELKGDIKTGTLNQVHSISKSMKLDETLIDVMFRCKLVSAALSRPEYCSILPLPAVALVPSRPSVTEGEDLSLSCRARGVQNSSFQWLLDGSSCSDFLLDHPTHSNVISIKDIPLAYDGCNITCVVASIGNATATVEVIVKTMKSIDANVTLSKDISATSETSMKTIILIVCCSVGFLILLLLLITMVKHKGYLNGGSCTHEAVRLDNNIEMNSSEDKHKEHAYETRKYCEENIFSSENNEMAVDAEQNFNNLPTTYENVPILKTDEPMADSAAGRLTYVELDLDQTSSTSVIHNNMPQTTYSDIVLS